MAVSASARTDHRPTLYNDMWTHAKYPTNNENVVYTYLLSTQKSHFYPFSLLSFPVCIHDTHTHKHTSSTTADKKYADWEKNPGRALVWASGSGRMLYITTEASIHLTKWRAIGRSINKMPGYRADRRSKLLLVTKSCQAMIVSSGDCRTRVRRKFLFATNQLEKAKRLMAMTAAEVAAEREIIEKLFFIIGFMRNYCRKW